jgi:hypothetical protein
MLHALPSRARCRNLLRLVSMAAFLAITALWPRALNGQVVRITPKAGACDPALVDAALQASDLKDAGQLMQADIGQMYAQMQQIIRAQGRQLAVGEPQRVLAMMQQAFAADAVDLEIQRSMKTHCEPKVFASAVEQLNTSLAKKIRGFENQFSRSHSPAAINRYKASLEQRPPTQTREALVAALEKTIHAADFAADTNAQVVLALYMGLTSQATDDAQFGAIRDQLLPPVRQATRIQQLLTYRNASDEELDQYIMLLRTPDLQRFQTICKTAFQDAVVRRSQILAAMLKQHIDEVRAGRH